MTALPIRYEQISIKTPIGTLPAFTRPQNSLDFIIFDQFPQFQQISSLFYKDMEIAFHANKIRFVAVVMPKSYCHETREKVKCLIDLFFKKCGKDALPYVKVDENQAPLDTAKWADQLRSEARTFCLKKHRMTEIPLKEFTAEHLKVLGYTTKEVKILNEKFAQKWGTQFCLKKLSCFDYALLVAEERGVKELLFSREVDKRVMFERLQRWGFETVKSLEKGDLVLYIRDGEPSHMGVYIGEGLVKSKFGNDCPYATDHPLETVFSQYGFQMAFYRKNPQKTGVYIEDSVPKLVYK